jgi:hypothetical protein
MWECLFAKAKIHNWIQRSYYKEKTKSKNARDWILPPSKFLLLIMLTNRLSINLINWFINILDNGYHNYMLSNNNLHNLKNNIVFTSYQLVTTDYHIHKMKIWVDKNVRGNIVNNVTSFLKGDFNLMLEFILLNIQV